MSETGETAESGSGTKPRKAWRKMMSVLSVAFVFHVLGVISSVHAVMSTRTPQGTIAWAIALNTFPYLAVPAYWVLGRSRFQGYVETRRSSEGQLGELAQAVADTVEPYRTPPDELRDAPAGRAAERLADMPYLDGNSVELLVDGDATFASILEGIDAAREYILFQFFIVKDDRIGREVKDHLIARARDGVRVFFLYDEVGSHGLPATYVQDLTSAGVRVSAFNTRQGPGNRFQINFRNHRKVVVADGRVAWIGGHNVGDEYLGRDPKFGHWRDTHVRIEGPAALEVQFSFVEDWSWATGEIPELDWTPVPSPDENRSVLILPSGPADELETAALMFVHGINTAQKRIWIASPYFIPDEAVMGALQLAALRGVDVRILIPDRPDHLAAYLAAFTYVADAAATGARLYRYTDGFLHQKVAVIDHVAAAVGTANFDNRSFRLNFEITGIVADSAFNAQVADMLEADFANAYLMPPDALKRKPYWFRLAARVARLTAPIQ